MKPSLARHCPACKSYQLVTIGPHTGVQCPSCREKWGEIGSFDDVFKACPVCSCKQFYLSKDFNQYIGCLIMLVGIVLVPVTYGLSLPVFALIDLAIHKSVPSVINCYRCGSEFRGLPALKHFKPFMHHIGLKYDKYR